MSTPTLPLVVFRHVPWEGPHRLLAPFGAEVEVLTIDTLDDPGRVLPPAGAVRGAIVMGGPMSANDAGHVPRLAEEIEWLRGATALGVPILGICLGSQLLARALDATVTAGREPEIGVAPVEILDATDPLLAAFAPSTPVLHWHGEIFTPPPGATPLARSALTELQAYRSGDHAWGLLFHPEVDGDLVEAWIAEPEMEAEAATALGPDWAEVLRDAVAHTDPAPGDRLAEAFAARCERYAREAAALG